MRARAFPRPSDGSLVAVGRAPRLNLGDAVEREEFLNSPDEV